MVTRATRKASKVLCYTGIHSKKSGVHTPKEFLKITRKWAKSKSDCNRFVDGKYVCPEEGDVNGWMKWLGAEYVENKACRKSARETRKSIAKTIKNSKLSKTSKREEKAFNTHLACAKKECADEIAKQETLVKKITKQAFKCPKDKYLDCYIRLYKKTNGTKLTKKIMDCEQTKCGKTYKRLTNMRGW